MSIKNTKIVLASRPKGLPAPENFRVEKEPVPKLVKGQALIKVLYLSLDPYMRGRMSKEKSYADPVPIGGVITGESAGVVVKSRSLRFREGDYVCCPSGWRSYFIGNAKKRAETRTPFNIFGELEHPTWHQFFLVFNYLSEYAEANQKLVEWVSSGKLKYRETIVKGLEKAPKYFNWLFEGRNFGKLIVQVAKDKP